MFHTTYSHHENFKLHLEMVYEKKKHAEILTEEGRKNYGYKDEALYYFEINVVMVSICDDLHLY